MNAAVAAAEERRSTAPTVAGADVSGIYVRFDSVPGFDLALESLAAYDVELRAVTRSAVDGEVIQTATAYVPHGSVGRFLRRFNEYASEETESGNPRHMKLVERIREIELATVQALWTDDPDIFPDASETVWWEVWLRNSPTAGDRLDAFAQATGATVGQRRFEFRLGAGEQRPEDDRLVVLVRATAERLGLALDVLDDVAELRQPAVNAQALADLSGHDQVEFINDLLARIAASERERSTICVLDTGVSSAHPLIRPAINDVDVHAVDPAWPAGDADGHGTAMAGITLFGDLGQHLLGSGPVDLHSRLESVKILPDRGKNDPALYGAITASAAALVEIRHPNRERTFLLAVTAEGGASPDLDGLGEPSLWSATIDALAAGRQVTTDDKGLAVLDGSEKSTPRLFVVSTGNVRAPYDQEHLDRSDVEVAEDPAQSWNALVVGAATERDHRPTDDPFEGWTPLAPRGALSPFSRTTTGYSRQWRFGPDVVMEGGNAAVAPTGEIDTPPSLQVLATQTLDRGGQLLTTVTGTSPATAAVGHIVGGLRSEYPALWPETIRGLVVHSARWTSEMEMHFEGKTVTNRVAGLRRYGWGIPDLARARRSADDAVTLIAERTIEPYADGKMNEMHIHELPWPVDVLQGLGDAEVRMRVALSYFIEPNPSRRGWKRRHRYASHGLRFAVRRAAETTQELRERLNKEAWDSDEKPDLMSETGRWIIGPRDRHHGSLHVDEWRGTAADLSARGCLAVYPVTGWWKEVPKRDRSAHGVRYSLVVSIETPDIETDVWTPVAAQVGIPIQIET